MASGWIHSKRNIKECLFREYLRALTVDQLLALRAWQWERMDMDGGPALEADALLRAEKICTELHRRQRG